MHPLELVLQLQVGTDQAAVLTLPSVISSLAPSYFQPSPHLTKWVARVNSLIQSKHPGARWAGLCLALQTSISSKDLMLEAAQNWIAVTLPMLSRNETTPTCKACIRLLDHLFTSAVGIPEFQRQIATPNVPKFSAALVSLAEKTQEHEIRSASLMTLTHLIPLYPTFHRQLHPSLVSLSLRLLSGSLTTPSDDVMGACQLHAVLHFTGGKVGAAPLWRKSVDTALANAWSAFTALRTTFPQLPQSTLDVQPTFASLPTDPAIAIPLSLDRLRCSIHLINELLRAATSRPVSVSVGELDKLALCLLRCSPEDKIEAHFNTSRRALEISVIPEIWKLACALVSQMAKTLRHYLNPHLSRIIAHITHHLEQPLPKFDCIQFLRLLPPLLSNTHALHSPISVTRLVKTILPILVALLSHRSEVQHQIQEASTAASKKGKRRARGYDGDEVFKVGPGALCPAPEDQGIVEVALEALDPLLANPDLSASMRALSARLLVTLLLELPRHPPSALSHDLSFHGRVYARVLLLCNKHVLVGVPGWIDGAVGLIINAMRGSLNGSETVIKSATDAQHVLDLLVHPRLPPLLRSQPLVEAVSLFKSESGKDDKVVRDTLGVATMEDVQPTEEVTTAVQHIELQPPPVSAQHQSWTTTYTASTPTNVATVGPGDSTSLPILSAAASSSVITSPLMIEKAASYSQITALTDHMPSKALETAKEQAVHTSTYSRTFRFSNDEDSDDDEEMPEIDTRSDSD